MHPRRPRRLTLSHAAATLLRAAVVVAVVALTAAPEATLVWEWTTPQWMMSLPRGPAGPTLLHRSVVQSTEEVLTVPSFVFPTDVGVPKRLDAGIQSVHAVQRSAEFEPALYARAWRRAVEGEAAFEPSAYEYVFRGWPAWFDR